MQHGFFLAFVEPGGEGGGVHRVEAVGAFAVGVGGVEALAVATDSVGWRHEVTERICAGFRNGGAGSRGTVGGHVGGRGGVHGRGVVVVLGRGYVIVGVEGRLVYRCRVE